MAANKLLKIIFVIIQVVFILFGVGLITVGSWLEDENKSFRYILELKEFQYGAYVIIAAGCAIFLVSLIGIVGALCDTKINKFLLAFYVVLVGIIFIAELAGGILAIVYRARAENLVRSTLNSTLILYGVNSTEGRATTEAWDKLQQEFQCCGVNQVQDWINLMGTTYPTSCCPNTTTITCGTVLGVSRNEFFQEGCLTKLVNTIEDNLLVVAVVGMVFLIGEIVVILMAVCLLLFSDFDD